MYTITIMNTKGGSGKTTSVFVLASLLASVDYEVAVIDSDKAQNITGWTHKRSKLELQSPFNVITSSDPLFISDTLDDLEAKDETDFCIIDTEGAANELLGAILPKTDLVIISMMPSDMDSDQAVESLKLVRAIEKEIGREIKFVFSFSRTNAAIYLTEHRVIVEDLEAAGFPYLETPLVERSAYRQVFRTGELISELNLTKAQRVKANDNSKLYAAGVLMHLQSLEGGDHE